MHAPIHFRIPRLPLLAAAALVSLGAAGCTAEDMPGSDDCVGAKCDSLGDPGAGRAELAAGCYASLSTGAVRCVEPGLEGLAELISSGFDPIAPLQCSDVFVGEPSDPAAEEAIFEVVMPVCNSLPYCSFRSSSGSCAASWPFVGDAVPSVQCAMIDRADVGSAAKQSYCGVETCDGGNCEETCVSYQSATSGATRCAGQGAEQLAELVQSGEQPVLDYDCSEVTDLAAEMEQRGTPNQDALDKMRSICDAMPHCLYKESGDFCMPAWEIVATASPDVQCQLIDEASATESAKQAYCERPIEGACIGDECTRCHWEDGVGGPGSCTPVSKTMAN